MKLRAVITCIVATVAIFYSSDSVGQNRAFQQQAVKFGRLLHLAENYYIDSVNLESITEDAIKRVLADLDPHSTYLSKEEVKSSNEALGGSFEGVGVSFSINEDTLIVMTTVLGGPSEIAGLVAGDRIIAVDSVNICNIGLENSDVFKLLRGSKGSSVALDVFRPGDREILEFIVVRDKIAVTSLDAAYMLNDSTAYIKLNKFGATTANEFETALQSLRDSSLCKSLNLVLDLRGNSGGYLKSAIDLADNFLQKNSLIVYTDGLHSRMQEYKASRQGKFESGRLALLIDEGSASSSEILAGAIQDWDRGVVIGRRSFGKGLVQNQYPLSDGSIIRLTTAHFYTPSGRNLQRGYSNGIKAYRDDYLTRYNRGELFTEDSLLRVDSLQFKTLISNRVVYGGGGVIPDLFCALDTSANYSYINKLSRQNIIFPYSVRYIDKNRSKLKERYCSEEQFIANFSIDKSSLEEIAKEGLERGIEIDRRSLDILGESVIGDQMKAIIGRDLFGNNTFFKVLNRDDKAISKAEYILSSESDYNKILKINREDNE